MKTDVSPDFPPVPSTVEIQTAVKTVLTAMFHTWALPVSEDQNSPTREQIAEVLGFTVDAPELEVLGLFDEWGNDLMCMAPCFGLAYKAPEWDGQQEEGGWVSYIKEPAKLFVPPPKPEGDYYWSLDDAKWIEFTRDVETSG
jgi:hypothetical protein